MGWKATCLLARCGLIVRLEAHQFRCTEGQIQQILIIHTMIES